jgi:hypothetical protein
MRATSQTTAVIFFTNSTKADSPQNQNRPENTNKSHDDPSHKEQKKDVKIVNNSQEEHEIEIIVTEQHSPNHRKDSHKMTLGGRNEPNGPSNPNRARIDRLDFSGGKTHKVSILTDGEHQDSSFVVTDSEGMGPYVSVHVIINQFDEISVNTVA